METTAEVDTDRMRRPVHDRRRGILLVLFAAVGTIALRGRRVVSRTISLEASDTVAGWGRGSVGPDYFARRGAVDADAAPQGLVDDFDCFSRPDFDTTLAAAEVREFYERTLEWDLDAVLAPTALSLPILPFFVALSWWWRQTEFPFTARAGQRVRSRIEALLPDFDRRTGARVWIRTHDRPGGPDRVFYITQYSLTRQGDTTLMNIAFPLPPGNVTTLLRFDHLRDGAVVLTSDDRGRPERQGIWQVFGRWAVRGPVFSTLSMYPTGHPDTPAALRRWGRDHDLLVEQEIVYFGTVLMRLRYRASRRY